MLRLLDLFSGAGGAAMGYHRAGFAVTGIDIKPQPNYPFNFVHGDAFEWLNQGFWRYFDAIHASPPCQAYTIYKNNGQVRDRPDLIAETREALDRTGKPYVIENVPRSPLRNPVLICGSMFDETLDLRRHRLFETNWGLQPPMWPCRHMLSGVDRFPGGRSVDRTGTYAGLVRGTVEIGTGDVPISTQRAAMGIDWTTREELTEAVPPMYTQFIGEQLLEACGQTA